MAPSKFGPKMKILVMEFAYRVDQDERAHNEPPHFDFQCLRAQIGEGIKNHSKIIFLISQQKHTL